MKLHSALRVGVALRSPETHLAPRGGLSPLPLAQQLFLLSTYCIIAFLDVEACASRARRSSEGEHRTTVLQQYSPRGICPKIANAFDPLRTDGDGLITHLVVTGIGEATTLGLRGEH